jgi:hypothetical protein
MNRGSRRRFPGSVTEAVELPRSRASSKTLRDPCALGVRRFAQFAPLRGDQILDYQSMSIVVHMLGLAGANFSANGFGRHWADMAAFWLR